MANLVILYENFADQAILTGGSWQSALPDTNVLDQDIQRVARSSDASEDSTQFTVDLGRPQPVGGIAFGPTNMSPGSSWRVRAYAESTYTTVVYDSAVQSVFGAVIDWSDTLAWLEWENPGFWLGVDDFAALDELPQFNYHVVPDDDISSAIAQYWLVEIFDAGNADGFVDVGRLIISRKFSPGTNYDQDNATSITPLVDVEESLGGHRSYWERGIRRTSRYTFRNLSQTEIFSDVFQLMLRSGISKQVFLVPDPDDATYGARRSYLATLSQIPVLQQLLVARGATSIDFEEVL